MFEKSEIFIRRLLESGYDDHEVIIGFIRAICLHEQYRGSRLYLNHTFFEVRCAKFESTLDEILDSKGDETFIKLAKSISIARQITDDLVRIDGEKWLDRQHIIEQHIKKIQDENG